MKFSTALVLLATLSTTVSAVSATGYFGYDIPEYPTVAESSMDWPAKPELDHLDDCKGINVGANTKLDRTIVVDHCLLDCKGYTLRGPNLDPVVYVRNGGQLVNCPIKVEQWKTGVVCDDGDCFLIDVSCQGDKNFDECVLVKNRAKDVVILKLEAVDPNGAYGLRAINAYTANIWLEASNIQKQRKDGVLAKGVNNLILSHDIVSANKRDGVDVRNVAKYVVALESNFNENGDEGFDTKRVRNFLFAYSEASRNHANGLEVTATCKANVGLFYSRLDENGVGTAENEDDKQNGLLLEGPKKVEMVQMYAKANKGDGFKMNNVYFLDVKDSQAVQNEADGFDLRHITSTKLYQVTANENYLTGVRSSGNGELYVEDNSEFYQNGVDARFDSKQRSGILISNTKKAFISETSSYKNGGYGFFTNNVPEIYIEYTKAYENHDDGFDIETSADVDIQYETISYNNKANGFTLTDVTQLTINDHVKASYNAKRGFDIQDVDHVKVYKTDSIYNDEDGFYVSAVQYFYAEGSVSAYNGKDGIFVDNGKVHTEVEYNDVIACENKDDGMVFQEGFDDGSFWFTPNYDVISCFNHDLDLQFDGIIDVTFGSSDFVASEPGPATASSVQARSFGGVNDITADTCADKNGDENTQACKDLSIAPCPAHFKCPTF